MDKEKDHLSLRAEAAERTASGRPVSYNKVARERAGLTGRTRLEDQTSEQWRTQLQRWATEREDLAVVLATRAASATKLSAGQLRVLRRRAQVLRLIGGTYRWLAAREALILGIEEVEKLSAEPAALDKPRRGRPRNDWLRLMEIDA